jgi:hypothetical protein
MRKAAPTLGQRRPEEKEAGRGRDRELEGHGQDYVRPLQHQQDYGPSERVDRGRRALGEQGRHRQEAHDRGSDQRGQRTHQQKIESDGCQHQNKAEHPREPTRKQPDRAGHQRHVNARYGQQVIEPGHAQAPLPFQREGRGVPEDKGTRQGFAGSIRT